MSDAEEKADKNSWKFAIGFTLLVTVGVGLAIYLKGKHHDEEGPGHLEMAHRGKLADGRDVVLVVSDVVHPDSEGPDLHTTRMDLIDVASGQRLVRMPRMAVRDCIPSAAGLAWCADHGLKARLSVYDLATLKVVKSADDLEKTVPALKKGMHDEPQVDLVEGTVITTLNDASVLSIAIAGCRTQCVSKEIPKKDSSKLKSFFSSMGYATSQEPFGSVKLADGREVGFKQDGAKSSMVIGRYNEDKPLGVATFLKPRLVVMKESRASSDEPGGTFRFGNEEIVIVAHNDTLDDTKAKTSFTAFDLEGRTKWTQQIGSGKFEHGFRVGDAIVIAVDASEGGYIFGLSLKDGRILWRQPT